MPEDAHAGIIKSMYLPKGAEKPKKSELCAQRLSNSNVLREVIAAADLLDKGFGVTADICYCPSFTELLRRWLICHSTVLEEPFSTI